jgi:hypothetical protein
MDELSVGARAVCVCVCVCKVGVVDGSYTCLHSSAHNLTLIKTMIFQTKGPPVVVPPLNDISNWFGPYC